MVLSVSATFAADDDIAVDDGITDDVLATDVVDDSDDLSEGATSNVVTKDNFGDYFDSSGTLTSDADELVFEGDFSEVGVSAITIAGNKAVKFTGNNATFKNVQFMVMQNNVTIDGFNLLTDDTNPHAKLIYIIGDSDIVSNIVLSNNNITFIAPQGDDGYAIFAGAEEAMGSFPISGLQILNNNIAYVGSTDGTKINNAIRVNGNDFDEWYDFKTSKNILIQGNTFDIQMPSVNVDYDPYTYAATRYSEGIAVNYCENVTFTGNKVKMKYNNHIGSADSLYVVSIYTDYMKTFESSSGAEVSNNEIIGEGYGYIYGINIAQDNFTVSNNVITLTANNTQANGIEIGSPCEMGTVNDNSIDLKAPWNTYGVNAWQMWGALGKIAYFDNDITLDSYLACGMEINQPDSIIQGNTITALGNFTYGIAASIRPDTDFAVIAGNNIVCAGNNVGFGSGDAILQTGSAGISTLGNAIIRGNNILSSCVGVVSVGDSSAVSNVNLDSNVIVVLATGNVSNYAVKITETNNFTMTKNNITFAGTTNGTTVTNGVYIFDTPAAVTENNFNLIIPAADIVWGPAPTYEQTTIAEGIVIDYVDNLIFENNEVKVTPGKVVGGEYNTIIGIDISNSANATVNNNNIDATGDEYIYALKVSGNNFTVADNEISANGHAYSCGINVEGPATGVIDNNEIDTTTLGSSYPIYAGMTNPNMDLNITNNDISSDAYYVVGIEAAGNKIIIDNNNIDISGNHTIGIGAYANEVVINDNTIISNASNVGNVYIGDNFGTETFGIKVAKGNSSITNNDIQSTGDYALDLGNNNANVTDNTLIAKRSSGDMSIINKANANITGVGPEFKTVLSAVPLYTVYDASDVFYVTALDENGNPIKNATIFITVNGKDLQETTDEQGVAAFLTDDWDVGEYLVEINYAGNVTYGPKSIEGYIQIEPRVADIVSSSSATVLLTAVKKGAYYKVTLKDDRGNVLAGKTVYITFNGKTQKYTTDKNGVINFKLSASKVGTQKITIKFNTDSNYVAVTKTATVKFTKEATKLTAKNKKFKKSKKVKKYSVTLKDSKGKAIKKVKVTIKVGKKTFKAKTNAKGKATFKIKKLNKKGTYKAKVNFAGNNLYNKVAKSVKITVK